MTTSVRGTIFEIQRYSIHDGPGIRTTVFLKGCPLRCLWCHNPEGIAREPHLSFLPERCIGCGYCFGACPRKAHLMKDGRHVLDRSVCRVCGACTRECYSRALELVGREVDVAEVMTEVLKDRPFYETSGGGMTLSGGEPLFQFEFTEALLRAAKAERIHRVIETCGFADRGHVERLIPLVDEWLFDIKETDPERHEQFTGVSCAPILRNLETLHAAGAKVLLRLPIVPGLNDRTDHFDAVAALVGGLPDLLGTEVMVYHRLGDAKVERMALPAGYRPAVTPPEPELAESWVKALRDRGVSVIN